MCALATLACGCSAPRPAPQWVYFPSAPDPARVVHLITFDRLDELVRRSSSGLDALLGGASAGPRVGTPAGLTYRDGILYICDTHAGCVHAWDLHTGKARRLVGLDTPVDVVVGPRGRVFVADAARGEIVVYDLSAGAQEPLRIPQGGRPVALAVTPQRLYVANMVRHRVDVLSLEHLERLRSLAGAGNGSGQLAYPAGLAAAPDGELFVADMMNARVQVFDASGEAIRQIGHPGNRYGALGQPKDVSLAPDGTVFVSDAAFGCVHLFNQEGRLLLVIGGPNDQPGGTPMPNATAIAETLPEGLGALVPNGFDVSYFVWVSNTTGSKRLTLFAVGQSRAPAAPDRPTNPAPV